MKTYKKLTEIYRKAIIETRELTFDEAQANCHNLIVDLDAAVVRHIRWSRIRQIKRSCLMVS